MNRKTTLVIAVLLMAIVASPIVAYAQVIDSTESSSFEYYWDFESGSLPAGWSPVASGGGITATSYQDTYSVDSVGYNNPGIMPGDTTGYLRWYVSDWDAGGFNQGRILLETNAIRIQYQKNDACGSSGGVQYVTQHSGSFTSAGANCGFNADTWYNMVYNLKPSSGEIDIYIWEPDTDIPDSPTTTLPYDGVSISRLELGDRSGGYVDEFGFNKISSFEVNGSVTDPRGDNVNNVSIKATQGGSLVSSDITQSGEYSFTLSNGTYNITAEKPGYVNVTKSNVTVAGQTQTINFILREKSDVFKFRISNWMKHNSKQTYLALYNSPNSPTFESVTSNTTVTSDNTSILTVDGTNNTLISTSNNKINDRVNVTAIYTRNGKEFVVTQQVTVANRTMDNIEIMPPSQYIPAALGFGEDGTVFGIGSEIQWVLLAIFIGAGAAWLARNEWVGIGLIVALITFFWVLGNVSLGITMVGVFYGLFAGYQLNKIPGRSDTNVNPSNDVQPPEPPQQ